MGAAARSDPPRVAHGRQSLRRARLAARAPRHLASAALLILCALGLRATFLPAKPAAPPLVPPAAADAPSEDFALQFARAYLAYDAARPGRRQRALAPYLSGQLAAGAGFTPASGSRRVRWAEVASDQPALAGGRLVTVAAAVSGQPAPLYLAVGVRHEPGQPARPARLPGAGRRPGDRRRAPRSPRLAVADPALAEVCERVLRNYLAADAADLRADLSPGADVTLPTLLLRLREVRALDWVAGPGSGAVLATATATDPAANSYTLTYELGIADRGRPYVDFIEVVPTAS